MYPITYFGESASGIGALGFDGKAFLIQLITFVLAFLVLKRFVFKPILKVMQDRREVIESGVKLGEEMQKEKEALEARIGEMLQQARREADGLIAAAQDSAHQAIREAEDKAREKAAIILKEADSRIATDMARARKKLENEMVTLVAEATEAILQEKLDTKKDSELIERTLKEMQTV